MKHLPLPLPQSKAISRIRQFFAIWSLPSALNEIDTIFRKAGGDKAWRPPNPYNVIHCCEHLWKLTKAASALCQVYSDGYLKHIIAKPGKDGPDLGLIEHYKGNDRWATAFNELPRQLSAAEYRYPSKALRAYAGYRSKLYWKKFYKQLAECALSSSSLQSYEPAGKLFQLRMHVFKLIEACHLIHVRLGKIPISLSDNAPAGE